VTKIKIPGLTDAGEVAGPLAEALFGPRAITKSRRAFPIYLPFVRCVAWRYYERQKRVVKKAVKNGLDAKDRYMKALAGERFSPVADRVEDNTKP
jgi:hypothetical protein